MDKLPDATEVCPYCLYPLAGLDLDAQGNVICPACKHVCHPPKRVDWPPARRRRYLRQWQTGFRADRFSLTVPIVMAVVAQFFAFVPTAIMLSGPRSSFEYAFVFGVGFQILATVYGVTVIYQALQKRKIARERSSLAMGICPGCQYDISGLPRDAENRCSCPECGRSCDLSLLAADEKPES